MIKNSDISDFYQQLSLLIRSNLPLPDSLRQIGRYFPDPEFQRAILDLSARTARGEKLAESMRLYPGFFNPFHVQLISAAESSGTMPDILFIVARSARFAHLMTKRVRDLLGYPLLTINLCIIIYGLLCYFVFSEFRIIMEEILDGRALPPLTSFVLNVAMFIRVNSDILLTAYLLFLAFTLWLFAPGVAPHRVLLAIINRMPGSMRILQSLDSARLCNMLSAFLRQHAPLSDAMHTCSGLMERKALMRGLNRIEQNIRTGTAPADAIESEPEVDRLIALTFRHTPESELAQEMDRLSELFEHRVTLAARSATVGWSMFALIFISFSVGLTVIGMFLPLISTVSTLLA